MPRAKNPKRASERDLNILHKLTAQAITRTMRKALKDGEVPAALIAASISFLKVTETTSAERGKRGDPLAATMPNFDDIDGVPTPTTKPAKPAPAPKADPLADLPADFDAPATITSRPKADASNPLDGKPDHRFSVRL